MSIFTTLSGTARVVTFCLFSLEQGQVNPQALSGTAHYIDGDYPPPQDNCLVVKVGSDGSKEREVKSHLHLNMYTHCDSTADRLTTN